MGSLDRYLEKRDFGQTPEPSDAGAARGPALRYSVQQHDATRMHWDLRLEWDGVLLSWAVTRGPSLDPADKRLAVRTEDHPLPYLTFEGTIPDGNYGAGTVMLWDLGWWQPFHPVADGLREGHLHFALHGQRATGKWSLIRMKGKAADKARESKGRENWLLIKEGDAAAAPDSDLTGANETSVQTGRGLAQIAAGAKPQPIGRPRKGKPPAFRPVQLATLDDHPPEGDGWWHELKLDGYRALIALGKGGAKVWTRNGHDWTDRFASLVPAFADLPCDSALIDGEIVVGAGLDGFGLLQEAIKAGGPYLFYAFDLLALDGDDLTAKPQSDRRAALEKLLATALPRGMLRLSPIFDGDAVSTLEAVVEAGGEGLVSKLTDAPYRGGRGTAWIKTKVLKRQEFILVGWQPSDKKSRPFASLLLATAEAGALVYRGRVGTGFDGDGMDALAAAMKPLMRKTPPVPDPPAETRGATWLTPRLVAEIRYAEITRDGRLRHPVFVALRQDKTPKEVQMDEDPKKRPKVAGIAVSSGDRLIFPKAKVTKLDLARYYDAVAERMLQVAADRPVSLVRLPEGLDGDRFFQKHAGKGWPEAVKSVPVEESDGTSEDYIYVDSAAGLVGAAQMGSVEFHLWGARRDRLDRPDRLVFDLDPDEGLGFPTVRRAAVQMRDRLADLGLPSWPMVTGGKGVHVIVDLKRTAGWETVGLFARLFATLIVESDPKRYIAKASIAERKGKIFIDWLRNGRGATAVAPFSVRARPGAPVAMPVSWDELAKLRGANAFDMAAAQERAFDAQALPGPSALTAAVLDGLAKMQG